MPSKNPLSSILRNISAGNFFRWRGKNIQALRSTKLLAKRVIGKEPWLRPALSLPTECVQDWLICPQLIESRGPLYSLGVGCNIKFDVEMIGRFDLDVHAFDPTPSSIEWIAAQSTPSRFNFHPWAVADHDGTIRFAPRRSLSLRESDDHSAEMIYAVLPADLDDQPGQIEVAAMALPNIAARLGHSSIEFLKMDIEGAEYDVIQTMVDTKLRPAQIVVEFHHRHPGRNKGMTVRAVQQLDDAGYSIFAISDSGREFSFALRKAAENLSS